MPKRRTRPNEPEPQKAAASDGIVQSDGPDVAEPPSSGGSFPIVGVGASAGGLEAFTELLKHLPVDTGMGFVLVQHLDPVHESALTQILARATRMPVLEVTNELRVEPNHVYVIPPNTNLGIAAGVLKLQPRSKARTPTRSIDFFLESLAADQHERAVGVILSGTATDGTLGLEALKAEGGITFAQDDSAKYDSMPRSAVAAGCVDFVLSPEAIAEELARLATHPYVAGPALQPPSSRPESGPVDGKKHQKDGSALPSGGSGEADTGAERARSKAEQTTGDPQADNNAGFKRVLSLLRNHCGVDFTLYKSSTIQRRIARRMLLCRQETLAGYAEHLRGNTKELDTLFSDVLISVTSFFRNPDAFEVLQHEIFPKLLAQSDDEPLRVWVLGCSTGQEAYSIAMAFLEAAEKLPQGRKLQVFATDLNEAVLEKARLGLYAKTLAADLSPERLRRFFVEEGGGYRVTKSLREMVVFARQNIISDPPFSRIDIITCRNLLIYLEPSLQKKIFPLFHYALKPHGFLWLGGSESIGGFTELFEPLDRKQKLYRKKAASMPPFLLTLGTPGGQRTASSRPSRPAVALPATAETQGGNTAGDQSAQREADRVMVSRYAPPGVLINADRQVLQFRGATGAYLEAPSGAATFDVLKMAREGLMLPLRAAINEAAKENKAVRRNDVRIEHQGTIRYTNLQVIPLKNLREPCFLILFDEADETSRVDAVLAERTVAKQAVVADDPSEDRRRIGELENDLNETREYLQSIQESHESSNEELQAASEEVQSANEELQSLNEELTTSKEELESSNEELTTVNDEMTHRNAELSVLGNDLLNLQNSARLVMVLLGRDLTVRRFSAQAAKHFNLVVADIGRPIGHVRHRLELPDLEALITEVIDSVLPEERELQDKDGRWFSLSVRPYVTFDKRVDGAVLVLVDIDHLKRSEQALLLSEGRYRAMFAATSVGVTESDPASGRLLRVNDRFAEMLGYDAAEVVGKTFIELTHGDERQGNWNDFARLVQGRTTNYEIETRLLCKNGNAVWVLVTANMVRDAAGQALHAVAITLDISERKRAEEATRESERHFREMVDALPAAIYTTDADGRLTHFNPAAAELAGRTPVLGSDQWCVSCKTFTPDGTPVPQAQSAMAIALREDRPIHGAEAMLQRPDGSRVWVRAHPTPVHDAQGRLVGGINMLLDITESRRAEEALREADRRKDEFLAMLAHELRNPLAPIRNALQILRDAPTRGINGNGDNDTGSERRVAGRTTEPALQMMERQVAQMVRLVDDLLDVSRVSLGKIELRLERVSLAAVMHQVEQAARSGFESRGVALTLALPEQPVVLNADPTRLVQIIGNLVNNACKFTQRDGRVELAASLDGAATIVIRVRDNGIGIAAADLPRVFQLFTQVDSSMGRAAGGLGIGLALVKDLVALHGGTVAVHSDGVGQGSEFEVRLPVVVGATEAELEPAAPKAAASTGRRIMIVDDNRDAADSLSFLLQYHGHETELVYDGLAAVEVAKKFAPAVILMDLGLPKLDGYEATRRIREQRADKRPLIVALTGWGQDEDRRRSAEAGFDAHLVKPVAIDALLKLLG